MIFSNRLLNNLTRFVEQHRVSWFMVFLFSIMSIIDIQDTPIFGNGPLKAIYIISVSMLKATIIILSYAICRKNRILKLAFWILLSGFFVLSAINFVSYTFYGFGLSRKLILILSQATVGETYGFLPGLFDNLISSLKSLRLWVGIGAIAITHYCIIKCSGKSFITIIAAGCTAGLMASSIFCVLSTSGRTANSVYARTARYSRDVWYWNKRFTELSALKKPLPFAETAKSRFLADNIVVVIGESASRSHHSIYGYPLPTTPRLDSMRDNIIVFGDIIGSSASTSGNMERILSFKEDDTTSGDGFEYPLLVDVFRQAGYKVFWLSNQERAGSVSNTSGVMVMNADVVRYVGADNSKDALCFRHDEILLPCFSEAMQDTAKHKMIFMHLLGSHVEYSQRYPSEFGVFSESDELKSDIDGRLDSRMAKRRAEYDNSIRYTDHILAKVISRVDSLENPTVMIYFSDHGENVYDDGLYSGRGERFVEVPFIVYPNGAYRDSHKNLTDRIVNAASKPMSTANLVHMLLSISGTSYELYDSTLDVTSPTYRIKPRYVDEKIWSYEHIDNL